jgi:hypothetical protein
MSRNGSGTYSLPAGNPVVTGTTISTTWANNTLNDLAAAMTDSVAADGQTPMTGDLDMNSNSIKNLADPTLSQDAATKIYTDTSITAQAAISAGLYLAKASNLSDVANVTTSRANLVAAKSGANSDITSITGLTTPLAVSQGGVGAATLTANNVLLGNGTSALQAVAPSTTGNVLTSNGTTWVSSQPTTSVIKQVISTTKTDSFTSTVEDAWTDITGMSINITPSSSSNKVMIMATLSVIATDNFIRGIRLVRNSTPIAVGDDGTGFEGTTSQIFSGGNSAATTCTLPVITVDSPATTSSTNYKFQFYLESSAVIGFTLNRPQTPSASTWNVVSSITAMEILG